MGAGKSLPEVTAEQVRGFRMRAHYLDPALPAPGIAEAAAVCGLPNSPPGAWEAALRARLPGCTQAQMHSALYEEKTLLQAWSLRGAPYVFPTADSAVFLTALCARPGEEPWIYTRGIEAALDFLQLPLEMLLPLVEQACVWLEGHTVTGKAALDRALAALVEPELPARAQPLWRAPSMYGQPDRQTVGEAAVSFLLRPCAFAARVVFGRRQGVSPTFTGFHSWTSLAAPPPLPDAEKVLVRRFVHAHGPASPAGLAAWLGSSRAQAQRLWDAVAGELEPVRLGRRVRYVLRADLDALRAAQPVQGRLLLSAHDPYLDIQECDLLLADPTCRRQVWRTVGNPGVLLEDGRITGLWRRAKDGSPQIRLI